MPVHNKEIAIILNELADLLDIKGENKFKVRSYRNATDGKYSLKEMAKAAKNDPIYLN
jgi:DNA polymerase/3'-5' exonuclease PolX